MKVALVGNPNVGKSTLFNQLTGLHQKVGNFPGVTVDKRTGFCRLSAAHKAEIIDLPGLYSIYPKSPDEAVVLETLLNPHPEERPNLVLVIADASNLKRNLLLFSQVRDLGYSTILVLNLLDEAESKGLVISPDVVSRNFNVEVISINARNGSNLEALRASIHRQWKEELSSRNGQHMVNAYFFDPPLLKSIKQNFRLENNYEAFQYAHHYRYLSFLEPEEKNRLEELVIKNGFDHRSLQSRDTLARYEIIEDVLKEAVREENTPAFRRNWPERLDRFLIHRFWGYLIFLILLFLLFQAVYAWAAYPMDLIDQGVAYLQNFLHQSLPSGPLNQLLTEGVIAGLGGIIVFVPQIAVLFAFIAFLEESGYMARVVFLMDKMMRKVGLNGKSVVPLLSGVACAVPAIMATRGIDNWKERLITIFVTPLMSCSARLPVYTILIALVVPDYRFLGIINLQGLTLLGLYLLGFFMALLSAALMNLLLKTPERSFLIMELPTYKVPNWANMLYTVWEKVKTFIFGAGKVILAISVILWVLSSYGPPGAILQAEKEAQQQYSIDQTIKLEDRIASKRLEASYAGQFGKLIEPLIMPLGFDWKIGIAIITSFAAREVFVGTISTIYSVGSSSEDFSTIKAKMKAERDPDTGEIVFDLATGFSLLIFYAFAMQCMSTMAVVYRETKGWKWPLLQFLYLTILAYVSSLLVYTLLA